MTINIGDIYVPKHSSWTEFWEQVSDVRLEVTEIRNKYLFMAKILSDSNRQFNENYPFSVASFELEKLAKPIEEFL